MIRLSSPADTTIVRGSASISADEKHMITHNLHGTVDLYAISGGRKTRIISRYKFDEPPRSKHCLQVAFVQRYNGILCGTTTGSICIWYKNSGELFQKLHHNGKSALHTLRKDD